jgi:hypothetical protein
MIDAQTASDAVGLAFAFGVIIIPISMVACGAALWCAIAMIRDALK